MNTHYIPRLLIRQFATGEKINTYDFLLESFQTKKIKNTFSEQDLYDEELEKLFALKLEGPIGNLLNHRLLANEHITMDRRENMLLRKFLLMNSLRAPIVNETWDKMVERTQLGNHPSVLAREFLLRHDPTLKEWFDQGTPSEKSFARDLKIAMEYDSIEELTNPKNRKDIPLTLQAASAHALAGTIAFWDSKESGQEFILPKLPGASLADQISRLYKSMVIKERQEEFKKKGMSLSLEAEFDRLMYGSMIFSDNFSIYPISSTRVLICFSPYFRAFFPIMNEINQPILDHPILEEEQFKRHFFYPMRMELFEPCKNMLNKLYQYEVKPLAAEEVMQLNSLLLDMETEEFAFHDYNKIRDSFWYYDNRVKFALPKKHDFSHMV